MEIFRGRIVPGKHILAVRAVYRGSGFGVFSYLKGYRFNVQGSTEFNADGGKMTNIRVGAHDVHTLLFAASGTFTAHPTQYAKLPYDPTDLVPLARVSSTIIAVSASK